jgi:hypothetical protein
MKVSMLILVVLLASAMASPKPDTSLFIKPDTVKVIQSDTFIIVKHYRDSSIFAGADTIAKPKIMKTKAIEAKKQTTPIKK